jgi:hypothetical protein
MCALRIDNSWLLYYDTCAHKSFWVSELCSTHAHTKCIILLCVTWRTHNQKVICTYILCRNRSVRMYATCTRILLTFSIRTMLLHLFKLYMCTCICECVCVWYAWCISPALYLGFFALKSRPIRLDPVV